MKPPIFTGSSVAIVTPFKEGKIDYEEFYQLNEIHPHSGTSAITAAGTTGECLTLTDYVYIKFEKYVKR